MTKGQLHNLGAGIAVAILLAGCSATGAVPQDSAIAAHPLAGASSGDLLYLSEALYTGSKVAIFSYPGGRQVGTLTGVNEPRGLCSDARGNVFVTSYQSEVVFEYKHGATKSSATLPTLSHTPLGCAVDPKTNTLAVTTDNGDVGLFKNEKGQASYVNDSAMSESVYCTYDANGDLFADGFAVSGVFVLAELPAGKSTMQTIALKQILSPGLAVQWDGKYLALQMAEDFNRAVIGRFSVSGSTATLISKTPLRGSPDKLQAQFWISQGSILMPYSDNEDVGVWNYPAGGKPTQTITDAGSSLVGITLSVKGK